MLFQLRRASVKLDYKSGRQGHENLVRAGGHPLRARRSNQEYDALFSKQFHDLDQFQDESLDVFVDALCDVFVKYHRDRSIVPRPKQEFFCGRSSRRSRVLPLFEVGRHGRGARRSFNLRRRRGAASPRRRRRGLSRGSASPSVRAGQD